MDRIDTLKGQNPVDVRRKLGKRLLVAGGLIVILLGALFAFEQLAQMEDDSGEVAESKNSPVKPPIVGPSVRTDPNYPVGAPPPPPIHPAPGDEVPKVTPPVGDLTPPPKMPDVPPKPDVSAQPALPAPVVTAPPPPVVAARPAATTSPVPSPSTKPVARPLAPGALRPEVASPVASVPEGSGSSVLVSAPVAPVASAKTLPTPPARVLLPQLRKGYVLQAGVFMSTERAEELRTRLMTAGVPVTVESRVQVGPFNTEAEATAARAKVKALGIDTIVIPPAKGNKAR